MYRQTPMDEHILEHLKKLKLKPSKSQQRKMERNKLESGKRFTIHVNSSRKTPLALNNGEQANPSKANHAKRRFSKIERRKSFSKKLVYNATVSKITESKISKILGLASSGVNFFKPKSLKPSVSKISANAGESEPQKFDLKKCLVNHLTSLYKKLPYLACRASERLKRDLILEFKRAGLAMMLCDKGHGSSIVIKKPKNELDPRVVSKFSKCHSIGSGSKSSNLLKVVSHLDKESKKFLFWTFPSLIQRMLAHVVKKMVAISGFPNLNLINRRFDIVVALVLKSVYYNSDWVVSKPKRGHGQFLQTIMTHFKAH